MKKFLQNSNEYVDLMLNNEKASLLQQHSFYHLDVHLVCAKNLLAKDSCGTSDPYVKFKIGDKIVYKSRIISKCLDPKWDEYFVIPLENIKKLILIEVFDDDFGFKDDFLGNTSIDLTQLNISEATDLRLSLTVPGTDIIETCGEIYLSVTLIAKTEEEKEMHFNRGIKTINIGSGNETSVRKLKTQLWDSVVNIVLVKGKDLIIRSDSITGDIHVKFKLGSEKYKSKSVSNTSDPVWPEQFILHSYPDQPKVLEISVFYKNDELGKCVLKLKDLTKEETHKIWAKMDGEGGGSVLLLLTISATLGSGTVSDLSTFEESSSEVKKLFLEKYSLSKSFTNINNIGKLIIKVFEAKSLAAADIGGKSDPFCVLELVNSRLQTNTVYKTLCPKWNKIYMFNIEDIHSVLEITIFDEDSDKKTEFLGKVAIPLLNIKNGEKKWIALKDIRLLRRVKGEILLEMHVFFNKIKASIRTFNPRETKFIKPEQTLKLSIFNRNVTRIKSVVMEVIEIFKFMKSCFKWESPLRTITALILFLISTYYFELYMAPLLLIILLIKNYIFIQIDNYRNPKEEEFDDSFNVPLDEEEEENKNEEKKSLREKWQSVQEITAIIQNVIGEIASFGERVKNTFNFSVPFLSWLAIIVVSFAAIILYYIPLRYLIMIWGFNKFTKKLRAPNAIDNNELLDFLSRVPDNEEKIMYRRYKVQNNSSSSDINKKSE